MKMFLYDRLMRAVRVLSRDVWSLSGGAKTNNFAKETLLEHLVFCVLGSQVTFEVARAFTLRLSESGLLSKTYKCPQVCEDFFKKILVEGAVVNGRLVKYRFPNVRSKQLAEIVMKIGRGDCCLEEIVSGSEDIHEIRQRLVFEIPGLGLKQASMFLRDVGKTDRLAILDSHVIKYMSIGGMFDESAKSGLGRRAYLDCERQLVEHANGFGYPVGCVDRAIWVVMRTALKEGYL